MKKTFSLNILMLSTLIGFSQQATVIDAKSMIVPRYADITAINTAISSPQIGMMVYNNATTSYWYYNGAWTNLAAALAGSKWNLTGVNIWNSNAGNVGIGTNLPNAKLEVIHGGASGIRIKTEANFQSYLYLDSPQGSTIFFQRNGTTNWRLSNINNDDLALFEDPALGSRLTIKKGTGNFGFGITNPTSKVHIASPSNEDGLRIEGISFSSSTANALSVGRYGNIRIDDATSGGRLTMLDNGYTGFNATAPKSRLEVNGTFATAIKTNTSSVSLDETATIWDFTGGNINSFPSASTCPNRRYIIINRTTTIMSCPVYLNFTNTNSSTIPANSSIEIVSNGTNWLQIK